MPFTGAGFVLLDKNVAGPRFLPTEVMCHVYSFDRTKVDLFDRVLQQFREICRINLRPRRSEPSETTWHYPIVDGRDRTLMEQVCAPWCGRCQRCWCSEHNRCDLRIEFSDADRIK